MAGSRADGAAGAAVERGVTRLCALQEAGRWRGFPTRAGESDVWVTAFVVAHLRELAPRRAALAAARAWLAARRSGSGGWSYGGDVPPDADSTAWSLMGLHGSARLSPQARSEAQDFLASHQTAAGTATYLEDGGIRAYIGADPALSLAGWTAAHPDVTVAALLAGVPHLGSEAGLQVLRQLAARQSGAGFWDAYWWRGPLYTTALILRAVQRASRRLPEARARRILGALEREQLRDGGFGLGAARDSDPFTTALALKCYCRLAYLGGAEGRRRAMGVLLAMQQDDAGWSGDYVLRIPAPDVVEPRHVSGWARGTGGGNSYVLDTGGVFATTIASFALAHAHAVDRDGVPAAGPELPIPRDPWHDDSVVTLARC